MFSYCCFCFHFTSSTNNGKETINNLKFPNKPKDSKDTIKSLSYLDNIEYKDTTPFLPLIKYGKVVKVYDGDTITVASRLDLKNSDSYNNNSPQKPNKSKTNMSSISSSINDTSPVYRYSVRLKGIDTPELKTKNVKEKIQAKIAKDKLEELVLGKQNLIPFSVSLLHSTQYIM